MTGGLFTQMNPLLISGCLSLLTACAEPVDPPGPALLFAGGRGELSAAERLQVFDLLGLSVTPDGGGFVDQICGQPAGATVEFRDMNSDGLQEILLIFGNTCTSGHAGSSAVLLIRDADGVLQPNLGFPAASADPLPATNQGYPDLLIGGPGFCFPVWRWNGKEYIGDHNEPQMPGGCDHMND